MQYLKSFRLATESAEAGYILSISEPKMNMTCYSDNVYPFKVFPQKGFRHIDFAPVTVFYGGNGSGKSTLLNVIAQKLKLKRSAPFNSTPFYSEYLKLCEAEFWIGNKAPDESKIITSDDVFDFLLDIRAINDNIEGRRGAIFDEYDLYTDPKKPTFLMKSLDDYEELKRRSEARGGTKAHYTAKRMPRELAGKSNGESAFSYFTHEIKDNALYLLDEPENSLSAKLQLELMNFIADSVRFYNCQFVISTHSPFLLSLRGAEIYDLDAVPATKKKWTELENIILYHELFEKYKSDFN